MNNPTVSERFDMDDIRKNQKRACGKKQAPFYFHETDESAAMAVYFSSSNTSGWMPRPMNSVPSSRR